MKKVIYLAFVFIVFLSCKNEGKQAQDVDNQRDMNNFDLNKYKSNFKYLEKLDLTDFIREIDSIRFLYHSNNEKENELKYKEDFSKNCLDSLTLYEVFQDSSKYYLTGFSSTGGFSFHFNSLIFETTDLCGITINRISYDCWITKYDTFLLVYRKGKLIGIKKVAEEESNMSNFSDYKTKSTVLNENTILIESIKIYEETKDIKIDTSTEVLSIGFQGNISTNFIYKDSKPLRESNYERIKSPLTGELQIHKVYFNRIK